jgi:F0F1-type ATP synthase membrane subunit b/b'
MNFPITLILNGGLFDFDLTFVIQAILFTILAFVTTNVFLSPISKQLDERSEFINYTLRKATILLTFGYEKLSDCVGLLTEEINELNRQTKLTRNYSNSKFEEEIGSIQKENLKILSKLKGDLSIKSAFLFSNVSGDLNSLTDKFFAKKFQSAS